MMIRTRYDLVRTIGAVLALFVVTGGAVAPALAEPAPPSLQATPASGQERALIANSPNGEPIGVEYVEIPSAPVPQYRSNSTCESAGAEASGETQRVCVEVVSVDELEALYEAENIQPTLIEADSSAQRAQAAECAVTALPQNRSFATSRKEACGHYDLGLVVRRLPDGVTVGGAQIRVRAEMTADRTSWSNTARVSVWSSWGIGSPATMTAKLFGCTGCVPTSSFVPTGGSSWLGTGSFSKTGMASGAVSNNLGGLWEFTANSPAWSNTALLSAPLARYRCDNAVLGVGPGCVFADIPAVVGFSSAINPNFIQHIYRAQVSGLPGQVGSGTYLTRLTNAAQRTQNGNKACPSSIPRPDGWECDEYPFRSTYQGAHTSGATQARSFANCAMNDPERTGPSGWSRCFIPAQQNASGGGLLGSFYSRERILDSERFQVGYLP